MPPQEAINTLRPVLAGNPAVNVLVASEPGQGFIVQRLNLRQDLADEFRSAAQAAQPSADVVLRPYDPGYTPDWNELAYIDLQENEAVANLVGQISEVQNAGKDVDLRIFPPGAHGAVYSFATYLLLLKTYDEYLDLYLKGDCGAYINQLTLFGDCLCALSIVEYSHKEIHARHFSC